MRRRLIFNVPPGNEQHYSRIQGRILGSVWAPIYHGYGYYMPASVFPPREHADVNSRLTDASWNNLKSVFISMLPMILFGWPALWRSVVGGLIWAESESLFATWDGHLSFGSSHVGAHLSGFYLYSTIRTLFSSTDWFYKIFVVLVGYFVAWDHIQDMVGAWIRDDFGPVSKYVHGDRKGPLGHRVDHVAHIGGLVTGMINAHWAPLDLSFKYLLHIVSLRFL
jgi:hypothetical protein